MQSWLIMISRRGFLLTFFSKLIQHAGKFPAPTKLEKAPSSMHDIRLHDLSLVINQPFWMLHEGNCEHFVVIDGIRYVIVLQVRHYQLIVEDLNIPRIH